MMSDELTENRKKILMFAGIWVVAILVFWAALSIPKQKQLHRLKAEYKDMEQQIAAVESIVDQTKPVPERIELLRKRHESLDSKFPDNEVGSLNVISDLAKGLGIEIVSTGSQQKTPLTDQKDAQVTISGKPCVSLFMTQELRSSYPRLVEYLDKLKSTLPAYYSIEKIEIVNDVSTIDRLFIKINYNLYLLSKNDNDEEG